MNPTISIIIPSYNYAHFIGETLACLLAQDYANWEAIVVDDGSTDDTEAVVAKWCNLDERIRYIHQTNGGLSAARNTGLKNSKGEFIQFLDADDLISKEKLSLQLEDLIVHPDVAISYSLSYYFQDGNVKEMFKSLNLDQEDWMPQLTGNNYEILAHLIKFNIMPVNAALVRKTVFDQIGDFKVALKSLEDWDFWLRCAFAGLHFSYLKNDLAYCLIRVHATSMSKNYYNMLAWEIVVRETLLLSADALTTEQKTQLTNFNKKRLRILKSLLIQHHGVLNFNYFWAQQKKYGFIKTLQAYIKAINDKRKN